LAALFRQVFFLAADQLGLAARFFLAAREFGFVDVAHGGSRSFLLGRLDDGGVAAFFALDERALLAHFDLDGAGLAAGIGLLDLARRLLRERDLLAFGRGRAVARLQEPEQLLLVGIGQRVAHGRFGHACALEL